MPECNILKINTNTVYFPPQYSGFETNPAILEAIEVLFDGSLLDDSEARYVWENGYSMVESRDSVRKQISGYLSNIGHEKGETLNWGLSDFIV